MCFDLREISIGRYVFCIAAVFVTSTWLNRWYRMKGEDNDWELKGRVCVWNATYKEFLAKEYEWGQCWQKNRPWQHLLICAMLKKLLLQPTVCHTSLRRHRGEWLAIVCWVVIAVVYMQRMPNKGVALYSSYSYTTQFFFSYQNVYNTFILFWQKFLFLQLGFFAPFSESWKPRQCDWCFVCLMDAYFFFTACEWVKWSDWPLVPSPSSCYPPF